MNGTPIALVAATIEGKMPTILATGVFMKMFRVLFTILSISLTPSAQASQVSQVELSGAAASQSIQMMDQTFEPITEEQPYQATCNREVLDHMETVCSTVSDSVCHGGGEVCTTQSDQVCNTHGCTTIPRRVCHQEAQVCENIPRRVCSDHAVMRTEYYGCTQYHTVVVGQRLVKTFQHSVEVAVDHPELLKGQRLVISLLAREASVTPTLVSSFSLNLLTVEMQKLSDVDHGATEILASRILVHVGTSTASIGKILSSSVQNLQLNAAGISLDLPGIAELSKDLNIGVSLTQHRFLISDKVLFNDSIDSASLSTVAQGDLLKVTIPLSQMQISGLNSNKRHNLSVSISLKRPALAVLNSTDLSAVLSKSLTAEIKDIHPN